VAFYNQRDTAGQWIKEGRDQMGRGCHAAPSPGSTLVAAVSHGRYVTVQLAEVTVSQQMFEVS
jgi:hypothetical protein